MLRYLQIVPYFLMRTLGAQHGLPGLFTASVFAAALRYRLSKNKTLHCKHIGPFLNVLFLFGLYRIRTRKAKFLTLSSIFHRSLNNPHFTETFDDYRECHKYVCTVTSSVSSAVNSLAALTLEDFIKPAYLRMNGRKLPERMSTKLSMALCKCNSSRKHFNL